MIPAKEYGRVSSKQQKQSGGGEAAQEDDCSGFAARNGYEIVGRFLEEENVSGDKPLDRRPALVEAMASMRKGEVLLVAKRDRLGRDPWIVMCVEVTFFIDESSIPPSIEAAAAIAALEAAAAAWENVCGVVPIQVYDAALARVVIGFAPIDGPSNVLGETELPCDHDATAHHTMILDSAEVWDPEFLRKVATHEFGHAIGLGHAPPGTLAVMDPYYDPEVDQLQPWDVEQAQDRYGPPAPPVTVDFEIVEPGHYTLTFHGRDLSAFNLTKG